MWINQRMQFSLSVSSMCCQCNVDKDSPCASWRRWIGRIEGRAAGAGAAEALTVGTSGRKAGSFQCSCDRTLGSCLFSHLGLCFPPLSPLLSHPPNTVSSPLNLLLPCSAANRFFLKQNMVPTPRTVRQTSGVYGWQWFGWSVFLSFILQTFLVHSDRYLSETCLDELSISSNFQTKVVTVGASDPVQVIQGRVFVWIV